MIRRETYWTKLYFGGFVFLLTFSLLSFFLLGLSSTKALAVNGKRKAVLIVVDRVDLSELMSGKNLERLASEGSLGLLNARTAKLIASENTYLTIGCGARADGGPYGKDAFNTNEVVDKIVGLEAGTIFQHRTGLTPPTNSVVNLGIVDILKRNAELPSTVLPGLLGETLKKNGLKVAVLGNADINGEPHREVALIAMDEEGIVPLGDVGNTLCLKDQTVLGGYRTDYETLLSRVREYLKQADFLVIELGDISRIDSQSGLAEEKVTAAQKERAIKAIDELVGGLLNEIGSGKTLVMVVTPTPSRANLKEKANLTSLLISGSGFRGGVLSSDTTRRRGIVSNTDIAPTILSFFEIETPYQMSGRPIFALSQKNPVPYLLNLSTKAIAIYQTRNAVLTLFVVFSVASIIIALLALLVGRQNQPEADRPLDERKKRKEEKHTPLKLLLLWALSLPLAFLFQPPFVTEFPWGAALFSLLMALALALISFYSFKKNTLFPIMAITMATSLALLGDTIFGSRLMLQSFLGSCPVAGGRFYGLGNTYMGAVVGSSIIGATALTALFFKNRKAALSVVALFLLIVCMVAGYPKFGANVGGLITAVGASVITLLGLKEKKINRKHLLYVALAVVLFLVLIIVADLLVSEGQSHAGRAVELIKAEGIKGIGDIINRKLTMNLKGIKSTPWGEILAVIILALPFVLMRLEQKEKILSEFAWFFRGLMGVSAGAILALIFNDTGIVAGGVITIYVFVPLLYLFLQKEKTE